MSKSQFQGRMIHIESHPMGMLPETEDNKPLDSKMLVNNIRRRSHYHFLEDHFDAILTRMGKENYVGKYGSFTSSGDKYYQYREQWDNAGIPFFHGAAMYHLMELFYTDEVRATKDGWVAPSHWVLVNYHEGHNLSQYMEDLS